MSAEALGEVNELGEASGRDGRQQVACRPFERLTWWS